MTEDSIHHPHDKLFKATFKVTQTVIDFLLYFFPPELTAQINLEDLTLDNTDYVSEKLVETFADVVYRTTWKGEGKNIAIALLLEHKSAPDNLIYVQLMRYMLAIWDEDIKADRPLTVIIPVVFYHGKQAWEKKPFSAYFKDLPPLLEQFIPRFDYHLTNLQDTPDQTILDFSAEHLLGTLMLVYKKIDDDEFVRTHFPDFFKFYEYHPELRELFRIFAAYFYHQTSLNKEEVSELSEKYFSTPLKSNVMTLYEQLIEEGKLIGIAQEREKIQAEREKAQVEREKAQAEREKAQAETEKAKAKIAKAKADRLKAIRRFLIKGKLPIPEIVEMLGVSVSLVLSVRSNLIKEGVALQPFIQDFTLEH